MTTYLYEVYVCTRKDTNEVVYVGQGKRGRHKHCRSDTSHCYGLNKFHFEGVEISIRILLKQTQEDALQLEKILIDKYQPTFNIVGIKNETTFEKRSYLIKEGLSKSDYKPTGKKANIEKHSKIKELNNEGLTREEIAKLVGCGVATVYRVLKNQS